MRFILFYHSLISDWNHGNAHFLRGVVGELQERGHDVDVFEPAQGWSRRNLLEQHGSGAVEAFHRAYPTLRSSLYELESLDLEAVLDDADVVIVHEWSEPELIARIGKCRRESGGFRLLFHDTHHRAVSDPGAIEAFDLRDYDGVLAFGEVLREIYEDRAWAAHAWTWHEAADVRVFHPPEASGDRSLDLVWIGNWGEGERADELREFLVDPVREMKLRARVHGVRYPQSARSALADAGIAYRGWLPNFEAPRVFGEAKMTVHVPRRFYADRLPGIPTIRMFEALACGMPLVSAPWDDCEGLFVEGTDYLKARDGAEMKRHLRDLASDDGLRSELARFGRKRILARHTCAHRVDELLAIESGLNGRTAGRTNAAEPRAASEPLGYVR